MSEVLQQIRSTVDFDVVMFVIFLLFLMYAFNFICENFAKQSPSNVRMLSFAFSTLWVVVFLLLCIGRVFHLINEKGGGVGGFGSAIVLFVEFGIKVTDELLVFAFLLGVFIVPQVFNYFIAGLFGCATQPILTEHALKVTVMLCAKSYCSSAGCFMGLLTFGCLNEYLKFWNINTFFMIALSVAMFFVSMFIVWAYHYKDEFFEKFYPILKSRLVLKMHCWFTRNLLVNK